jgi:hypothetical protein
MKQKQEIIEAACKVAGCHRMDYDSTIRSEAAVMARKMVAYYERSFQSLTYQAINPKNHTVAMFYVKSIKSILSTPNDKFREQVIRFLAIMATGQPLQGRCEAGTLIVTGQSKAAVYSAGSLTVINYNGSTKHYDASDMKISRIVEIMEER